MTVFGRGSIASFAASAGPTLAAWALLGATASVTVGCGGASSQGTVSVIHDPLEDTSAQQLYDAGIEMADAGDFIRAEQYLTAARDHGYPEDQLIQPLIGACVRSSRMSAALSYAEPYLEHHPEDWRLRQLVATIQMGLESNEAARLSLEHVVRDVPEEPVPHYMLAVLARDALRDDVIMREQFSRYLELDPEGTHAAEARDALGVGLPPTTMPVRLDAPVRVDAPDTTSADATSSGGTP
jgi:hypothetical protein